MNIYQRNTIQEAKRRKEEAASANGLDDEYFIND